MSITVTQRQSSQWWAYVRNSSCEVLSFYE